MNHDQPPPAPAADHHDEQAQGKDPNEINDLLEVPLNANHWESHVCPVEDWEGVDFTKFEADERIEKPLENDIILKNQYLAKHHEGNKYWIELTNKAIEKYLNTTSSNGKKVIKISILIHLIKRGARFLKQNKDGTWSSLSKEEKIIKKVHALF